MDWAGYAETCRRLADLRAGEAARRDATRAWAGTIRARRDALRQRLVAQRDHLAGLAAWLGLAPPAFGDVVPAADADPDRAAGLAAECLDRADGCARAAADRARQPALLPGVSPVARNALVYAAATLFASILAWLLFRAGARDGRLPVVLLPWSLCGLPVVAFFAGYLTLVLFGRPAVDPGAPPDRSVRLGWVICVSGLLVTTFALVVTTR